MTPINDLLSGYDQQAKYPYNETVAATAAYKNKVVWLLHHLNRIADFPVRLRGTDQFNDLLDRTKRLTVLIDEDHDVDALFEQWIKAYELSTEELIMVQYENQTLSQLYAEGYPTTDGVIPVSVISERTKQKHGSHNLYAAGLVNYFKQLKFW